MTMDLKRDQAVVIEWPGVPGGKPRRGAAASPSSPERRPETEREAVFDIADFEAIASFAGVPTLPGRTGPRRTG